MLQLDILPNGNTSHVRVQDASPKGIFEYEAVAAVEYWRFSESVVGCKDGYQLIEFRLKDDWGQSEEDDRLDAQLREAEARARKREAEQLERELRDNQVDAPKVE